MNDCERPVRWPCDAPRCLSRVAHRRALARANELVAEDSQIRRDALVEHGGMPQEVADAVNLPVYETDFAVDGMQNIADRMAGTGFLAAELDVTNLLAN